MGLCHGDFRNNKTTEGYIYRWMHDKGKGSGLISCVVASCNERERIIHTSIASTSKIAELLQREVLSEPTHLATPLCVNHYRQVHRLLHSDDHMYSDKKCHACHTLIRYCDGIARHCPNPAAVNQFFSMNGDTDINITPQDYVCTSCYNHHLAIISTSTDEELRKLLASHLELPPWTKTYIGNALRGVIFNLLLKRLAVLFLRCIDALYN